MQQTNKWLITSDCTYVSMNLIETITYSFTSTDDNSYSLVISAKTLSGSCTTIFLATNFLTENDCHKVANIVIESILKMSLTNQTIIKPIYHELICKALDVSPVNVSYQKFSEHSQT